MSIVNGLTVKEAAEKLGVGPAEVNRLVRTGVLVEIGRVGRTIIIDTESVERRLIEGPLPPGRNVTTGAGLRRKDRRKSSENS